MSKTDKLYGEYEGKLKTDVYYDGNFTVCIVRMGKTRTAVGCAKRNANSDEYVKERGVEIAMARALQNLDKQLHPRRYAKNAKKGTAKPRA